MSATQPLDFLLTLYIIVEAAWIVQRLVREYDLTCGLKIKQISHIYYQRREAVTIAYHYNSSFLIL